MPLTVTIEDAGQNMRNAVDANVLRASQDGIRNRDWRAADQMRVAGFWKKLSPSSRQYHQIGPCNHLNLWLCRHSRRVRIIEPNKPVVFGGDELKLNYRAAEPA